MITFCAHIWKLYLFWVSHILFVVFNKFFNNLYWVIHFLYLVSQSCPSAVFHVLPSICEVFRWGFYLAYWVFHFQHHSSFVFLHQLSLLNPIFTSRIDFHVSLRSLFLFCLSSLGCLNTVIIISVLMFFQVTFITVGVSTFWRRRVVLILHSVSVFALTFYLWDFVI